jgi:hypothetical protein
MARTMIAMLTRPLLISRPGFRSRASLRLVHAVSRQGHQTSSSTSAGARSHVKRPRGQSIYGALDTVDAAAQCVELTIRLQALASGQIFAQSVS